LACDLRAKLKGGICCAKDSESLQLGRVVCKKMGRGHSVYQT
jgi:hypothetical protein